MKKIIVKQLITAVICGAFLCAGMPATAAPNGESETPNPSYRINTSFPILSETDMPLVQKLRMIARSAERDFTRSIPDTETVQRMVTNEFELRIDFSVAAQTSQFISVREQGFSNLGGAHPGPIDGSVVYDKKNKKVINITELFAQPDQAIQQLSQRSRSALEKKMINEQLKTMKLAAKEREEWIKNMRDMMQEGTKPTAQNFSQFLILPNKKGNGNVLRIIFPPYQVAPYASGTQEVDIPVRDVAKFLAPSYRAAFGR